MRPDDLEGLVAGAIFDFAGYLAVHPDMPPDTDVLALVQAWAAHRHLSLLNANVLHWERIVQAAKPPF